jgi:hypothetical protein
MHQCPTSGRAVFIRLKPSQLAGDLVIHNNFSDRMASCRRWIIQVSALSDATVMYWITVSVTGNGGLGFDSGEGA